MTHTPPAVSARAQWLRRLAQRRRDRVGFVLSGGGPLGALQVGALRALVEQGVSPHVCVGCSVGALNAAFFAFNPTLQGVAELETGWAAMTENDLFPGVRFKTAWARFLVRGDRVFDNSGIRNMIERRLGRVRFEDAQLPVGVVATDLETGQEKVFTSGDLMDPLLASTAMPGVYPPVEIDGRKYIDGGVANNVPIGPAVDLGARTIYVLNATQHTQHQGPLARPIDYLLHAFSLARSQRLGLDERHYSGKVRIVMLPSVRYDTYVSFGSLAHTRALIDLSYEETKRFLAGDSPARIEEEKDGIVEAIVPGAESPG